MELLLIQMNSLRLLFQILITIALTVSTQFTYGYASMNDEDAINKIFETHGKDNVVKYISQERGGQVTIQKNKSFLTIRGKPEIDFITYRSILQDLKELKMDISDLESELVIYVEIETQKKEEEGDNVRPSESTLNRKEVALSYKLKHQIREMQAKYNKTESDLERRRLNKELSILRSAYSKAKRNEKSKLRVYSSDKKNSKYSSTSSNCTNLKSKLSELTSPDFRYYMYYCKNKDYRERPKTCNTHKSRYSGQARDLKDYKKKIYSLEKKISKNCS